MLIFVAMILGALSVVCIGITARQFVADSVALGPPVAALCTALISVALMVVATYSGQ
ncbi:hypothetical protein GTY65_23645 [Streptomyces sp. SID8379]|uniref:hypothetical protein n=1 Tax=unclassified Streptomyces TaxID=2593676 RepID=UPI00037C6BE4|nr:MULTISPECIES: hypothetical protein [unclassified Streptomyces]MYW67041.1 hypothetical protein [Streptomyces sp. SID8379]